MRLVLRQAIFDNGQWHERRIASHDQLFSFVTAEPLTDPENWHLPEKAVNGDIAEYCPLGEAIMAQLSHHIAHYGGGLLMIDYGKSDNHGDTVQAVRDHKPCDMLSYQGEADMTHWVDFARCPKLLHDNKARLIGPISQGRFFKILV